MPAIDRLKILLSDSELKKNYQISDEKIQSITMTPSSDELENEEMMIILVRELVKKQSEDIPNKTAASKLYTILDSRLPKYLERKK